MVAVIDQAWIPDADEVEIEAVRVPAMETLSENPRDVVPVGNPENESPLRAEYVSQSWCPHPKGYREPGVCSSNYTDLT